MTCPSCGTLNRPEARFCLNCGSTLARTCPNGHPVPAEARFCDECGAQVAGSPPPATAAAQEPAPAARAAERRLVSVLFADLVGFTAASEGATPRTRASSSPATSRPASA
jgi:adenylate cyclase